MKILDLFIKILKYTFVLLLTSIFLATTSLTLYFITKSTNVLEDVDEAENQKQLIVLISMDGLGSELIGQNTPFLSSQLQQTDTSFTLDMQTIKQSETMPSHISMITGLTQENHKFYLNSIDDETPPLTSETLFDYAIDNNYSYYAFLTKNKLLYLLGEKTGENILSKEEYSSEILDDIDNMVETENSKVFIFIHLRDIESYGHTYGWNSEEQKQAIRTLDNNLNILVSDFREEFDLYNRYFIFTADHGGEGIQHSNGCPACRRIPLIVVSENTPTKYELKTEVDSIYDTTCVVLDIMEDNPHRDLDCTK